MDWTGLKFTGVHWSPTGLRGGEIRILYWQMSIQPLLTNPKLNVLIAERKAILLKNVDCHRRIAIMKINRRTKQKREWIHTSSKLISVHLWKKISMIWLVPISKNFCSLSKRVFKFRRWWFKNYHSNSRQFTCMVFTANNDTFYNLACEWPKSWNCCSYRLRCCWIFIDQVFAEGNGLKTD